MFPRRFLAALLLLVIAWPAHAGWLTITNDTTQAVVVQESYTVGKQVRRGKPIKLMPGETLREFQTCAGTKQYHILDTALLFPKTLGTAEVTCTGDDQQFGLKLDKGTAKFVPADKTAVVKK
jgi:hypothetical protein